MKNPQENLIQDTTSPEKTGKGFGVEMTSGEAKKITGELARINDLINHDGVIKIEDLDNLDSVAKETKIDVGGEIMTVEEAEKIPDLKMNVKIWKEMSEGNFENLNELTRITPRASKYLENRIGDIFLNNLTSTEGLVLPKFIQKGLYLQSIRSAKGLAFPNSIKGDLSLDSLISTQGLVLPDIIGGDLILCDLTSAKDLVLPQTIGGSLDLDGLTSAHELVLPETIGEGLYLSSLTQADKQKLIEQHPQYADKIK